MSKKDRRGFGVIAVILAAIVLGVFLESTYWNGLLVGAIVGAYITIWRFT